MTDIVITGMASLVPAGPAALHEEIPGPVHRVEPFDPEAHFGRRRARFKHRSALLAMTACEAALADAGLKVTEASRDTVGITLGTTTGSITGIVEFGMTSFDMDHPFLVNAARFPNMGLNAAAAAAAIHLGVRGANSTAVGGPLSGVAAIRHAQITLRAGHVEAILAGASEEVTGPTVWWARTARDTAAPGEGAAVFVLERRECALAAGRPPRAVLAAATVRATDPTDPDVLAEVIAQTLTDAGFGPAEVSLAAVRATGVPAVDAAQRAALEQACPAPQLWSEQEIGDCYSAHSALQLAGVIDHLTGPGSAEPPPRPPAGLVVALDPDGAIGVLVVARPDDAKEETHA